MACREELQGTAQQSWAAKRFQIISLVNGLLYRSVKYLSGRDLVRVGFAWIVLSFRTKFLFAFGTTDSSRRATRAPKHYNLEEYEKLGFSFGQTGLGRDGLGGPSLIRTEAEKAKATHTNEYRSMRLPESPVKEPIQLIKRLMCC